MWLNLFFKVRPDTKDACQASCLGALNDLAQVASEQSDKFVKSELRESIALFDLAPPGDGDD